MTVELTLAISDYDHVRDLTSGRVRVEGAGLTCLQLPVEEIFFRFTAFREWEISELSLTKYVAMAGAGDTSVVAIPVFPSRVFRHSAFYVADTGPIRTPADLAGARIGIPEWFQTAGVWARGLLTHEFGLDLTEITWIQAGVNQPGRREQFATPPTMSITVVPDRTLSEMLLAGDLDAIITAHPPDPAIAPLFPDATAREQEWYRRTGIYPIMHVVVLRADALAAHPWLAANLLTAFTEARDRSLARAVDLNASRFPVPWLRSHAAEMTTLFQGDPFPYGMEKNRKTLEAFLRLAHEQGITDRVVPLEDLFPPSVTASYRI
jgi:4,5-dihydroxyphthalate decarboxylase